MPASKPKKSPTAAAPSKKPAAKKALPAKKASAKPVAKPASKPKAAEPAKAAKPAPAKKPAAVKPAVPAKKPVAPKATAKVEKKVSEPKEAAPAKMPAVKISPAFLQKQKQRLLFLKDELLDSMNGVAKDTLRSRAEGSEGSAFGMHQADAGSDAYDRDFALSLLSLEQNSLYEIDQALERIIDGTYGVCEISGKAIPHPRLEALPFTRYTVECQAQLEKQNRFRARTPVNSLFGLNDSDGDDDDDDSSSDQKD